MFTGRLREKPFNNPYVEDCSRDSEITYSIRPDKSLKEKTKIRRKNMCLMGQSY